MGNKKKKKKTLTPQEKKQSHLEAALRIRRHQPNDVDAMLSMSQKQRNAYIDYLLKNHDMIFLGGASKEERLVAKWVRDRLAKGTKIYDEDNLTLEII